MALTFDGALDDDLVTVVQRDDWNGLYVVRLADLKQEITIRLGQAGKTEAVQAHVSHAFQVPDEPAPHRLGTPVYNSDGAHVLHHIIASLTQDYRRAVEQGHVPSDDWLIEVPEA